MLVTIFNKRRGPRFYEECVDCGADLHNHIGKYLVYDCIECTKEKWAGVNHYHWLEKHLPSFMEDVGVIDGQLGGIIGAHGDKCSGYSFIWEESGIPFPHAVAVYLISYLKPWCGEVREVLGNNGEEWVDPGLWVRNNYHRFQDFLHQGVDTD